MKRLIKNYKNLSITFFRKIALDILEYGLKSLDYKKAIDDLFRKSKFSRIIERYKNIYLIGFGKGSSQIVKLLTKKIYFKAAYVIDFKKISGKQIKSFIGSHPLPSFANLKFSKIILDTFAHKLTNNDLVFVVVCGGGSSMLTYPVVSLNKFIQLNSELLKSGANIYEINTVRKHLDIMKGGGLAKILYPAKIISLIFSDVPGNDLSFIASGPTVYDKTTIQNAIKIMSKYNIQSVSKEDLIETPKEKIYFKRTSNILMLSNKTALDNMIIFAKNAYNLRGKVISYDLKGEVTKIAKYFLKLSKQLRYYDFIIAGGETTVNIKGKGKGGRNQELALRFLQLMSRYKLCSEVLDSDISKKSNDKDKMLLITVNSDGWDNTKFAGALCDCLTLKKAVKYKMNIDAYLANNDSFNFFVKVKDGIQTGKLPVNVADFILLFKNWHNVVKG